MTIRQSLPMYLASVFLALVTVVLFYLVAQDRTGSELGQILTIVAGMTTLATLTVLLQIVDVRQPVGALASQPLSYVSFNELIVSQSISEGRVSYDVDYTDRKLISEPWDLSVEQFIGLDNSLALAKLRMDLERELRRIAYDNDADITSRPIGVTRIARELVAREILPVTWLDALQKITSVCNVAVHGTEVSDDITISVAKVGGQLLERLRVLKSG